MASHTTGELQVHASGQHEFQWPVGAAQNAHLHPGEDMGERKLHLPERLRAIEQYIRKVWQARGYDLALELLS